MSLPVKLEGAAENPFKLAKAESRNATLFRIATAISVVAMLVFTGIAMFYSLGLIVPSPSFYTIVPLFIGAILSSIALTIFMKKASAAAAKAIDAKGWANELNKLKGWQSGDVQNFFLNHRLSPLPDDPLTLLPLIARFHYLSMKTQKLFNDYRAAYFSDQPGFPDEWHRIGMKILNTEALPTFFKAALCLKAIQNPQGAAQEVHLENLDETRSKKAIMLLAASDFDSLREHLFA